MQDKYGSFKKDLAKESTYQDLVEPRNKACEKKGATQYNVIDSIIVENKKTDMKADCPLFYDSDEFYNLNDTTDDDTWGGQTTTAIYTLNTLSTKETESMIAETNRWKEQLQHAIESMEKGSGGNTPSPTPDNPVNPDNPNEPTDDAMTFTTQSFPVTELG